MTTDPPAKHHPAHARAAALAFIDRDAIDAVLVPLLPDAHDRALVLRCLLDEGPAHHRGANWILIQLLAQVAGPLAPSANSVPVPMRVPPHMQGHTDSSYPLRLPLAPLERLATRESDVEAMIDALLDGPPQHALANAIMVCLIEAITHASAIGPAR